MSYVFASCHSLVFFSAMLLVCVTGVVIHNEASGADDVSFRLDGRDEASLRKAVYTHEYSIDLKESGGQLPRHAMNVPKIVNELYSKQPHATLTCLLKIAEGGRFEDSRNAAAFAFAAGRGEVDGSEFFGQLDSYDEIDKRFGESKRTMWVRMVTRLIEELKEGSGKEKPSRGKK